MRIGLGITAILVVGLQVTEGAVLQASDDLIKKAVEYGTRKADVSDEEFFAEWLAKPENVGITSTDNASVATIFTPFMQFAYFTHGEKRSPTVNEKVELAKSVKDTINFRILCYGKMPDFTKRARTELNVKWTEGGKQKTKTVKATWVDGIPAQPVGAGATFEDGSTAYGGAVMCSFDKKELRGDEVLTLKLFESTRKVTLVYSFDLRKIR